MERRPGATMAQVALLAAPFAMVSIWLGATVVAFGAASAVQGVLSGLAFATAAILMNRCLGRLGILAGVVLYIAGLLICIGDAVSWFMQGSSFNERFFAHVNIDNIPVSLEAYPWAVAGVAAGLLVVLVVSSFLMRRAAACRLGPTALLSVLPLVLLASTVNAPPHRLYGYFANAQRTSDLANSVDGDRIRAMLDADPTRPEQVVAKPGRNLVFVYLESVERTYADEKRFPGLTPNINRLRRQGLDFSGLETFPGVTYTISGLFSSQCGAPYLINSIFGDDFGKLGFVPNNDNTSAGSFHRELACLGDVLHAAGYDQTFLSGVDLSFANKNVFFNLHHYDQTLGRPEIEARHDGKLATEGWGLLDSDLYSEALVEYRHKEAAGRPFNVMLSTVDTHPPKGYVLPGCKPYAAIRNDMLDAVHCADDLLGRFIAKLSLEPGWQNTVVVVMSDHVSMRNVASPLYPPDDQRQPLLFILNAGQGDRPARMYHMDIAPTVLALLGVQSNVHFMAGADRSGVASKGTRLPADDVAKAVLREALWKSRQPPAICAKGALVEWDGKNSLDVGGWKLPLMLGGFPIRRLADTTTLLVFVDKHSAQLQILSRGEQSPWLKRARAQGSSVFQVTPFTDDDGRYALALDWLAPQGAWASMGQVSAVQDIHLRSPQCDASIRMLNAAKPGARLDFSDVFGTTSIASTKERRPGFVISSHVPASTSPASVDSAFMFARMTDERTGFGTIHINREKRITIIPEHGRPAMAEFDVSGLDSLKLLPHIDNLLGTCLKRKDTGIVGLRLSLDGQPVAPRFIVDRNYGEALDVPVHGGHSLRIDVDEGNSISDCDYFAVGFSDIVASPPTTEPVAQAE